MNTFKAIIILALLVLVGVQVHFDLAERAYVRQIAANQKVVVEALNITVARMNVHESFLLSEFPDQVKNYQSKAGANKK